jgi:acetoin utilization deacetylase AcuC-like enzyme
MSTAFFSHVDCRAHVMARGHPESPQRLDAIEEQLLVSRLTQVLQRREAPLVELDRVRLAHEAAHVDQLQRTLQPLAASGRSHALDADTMAGPGTWTAMCRAAVAATDAVIAGEVRNAFCAVRPPGHHATRDTAMGFCFFNNVAIAARHALTAHGLQRVAIVDFDVHHGNGTEDIIAGDDRVLMVSYFQHPHYPYSGDAPGAGNMLNLPVSANTDGSQVRALIDAHWMPRLDAFAPQMLFISAGFDAHREDPLGQLGLVETDYAWITRRLMDVADRHAQGRIVSCLEGGYHLGALGRSVAAHLRVLADVDELETQEPHA